MTARHEAPSRNIFISAIDEVTEMMADTGCVPPLGDVARCIGVPQAQLQIYFPDETALVEAMSQNALLLLHHTLIEAAGKADPDDPAEQFMALADAYIEWGFRYPREFRVIGLMPTSIFEANPMLMRYERSIHELMAKIMERALGDEAAECDLSSFLSIAHSYAFGVVSKMLAGDLARWNPGLSNREAARQNMRIFIRQFLPACH